jgi:ParB/RepB/Spo0J family partition protein
MEEHGWIGGGLPVRNDPEETNRYQLVWGERRLRAAKLAGLKTIPCEISTYTDDDMTELGLLENVQRENLTNYELGMAYKSLLALQVDGKPKYSIRTLAKCLGFNDKSAVERMLVYARAPEDVQELAKAKPDVAPRIVHELTHMKEEDRAPVIAAVLAGGTDIEDVRAVRKHLQTTEEQAVQATSEAVTPDVIEEAPDEAIVVKKQPPAPHPMQAERVLMERRMKRENGRILEILTQWSDVRGTLDETARLALLDCLTTWETAIVQLKQLLQQEDQKVSD